MKRQSRYREASSHIPQTKRQGKRHARRADYKGECSSPVTQMESLGPISRGDGVTWHLPEMKEGRTEPEVEIQYSRTISGNENDRGSFRGYVFFSRPGESNTKGYCGSEGKIYVFSSSSEASEVAIVFTQCYGIDRRGAEPKPKSALMPKPYLFTLDMHMQMQARILSRGMELPSSGLKYELMEQEHNPNTDLRLLRAAYALTSNRDFNVPDPAIYNQRTPLGNTVLHLVASYGNNAILEKVAQQAPYLFTVTNNNYDTSLHAAARAGRGSAIQFMLNAWLAFVRRETNGHQEDQTTLQMMLLVSLTLQRNKQGNTFFHEAFLVNAHNGAHIFNAFQDFFMKDGPELEADFKKIVNHLAVFAINREGKSLLYVAIEVGCNQVVDQLLDICLQFDLEPQGKSPFLEALIKRNIDMLQTILSKKPNWIHLRNKEGWLPLHQAAFAGYHEGVSYLVNRCLSCTIERENNGFFPIHLACIQGHVNVVKKLLKFYPDPAEVLDKNSQTLLHVAAKSGKYELVRYILQHPKLEILINQKDNKGNTPLHLATFHCHPKIVHLLTWDNRVNLSILNQENQTALDIADGQDKYSFRKPSLAERLTWSALLSAGTPRNSDRSFLSEVPVSGIGPVLERVPVPVPYKDRIDTLILVSTLIITASFAAGFAMPGDVDQGTAVRLNHVMFHLFILCLTISIFGAIIATIILLWARLDDLQLMLFAVKCVIPVLGISLTTLSLAYLAGVYLVVSKLSWLATTFLVLSVVLMAMVVLLYALLWLPSSSTIPFIRYISYYPFLLLAEIAEGKIGANHKGSSTSSTL